MGRLVLYPGSFDPFTLGHLNIVQRALQLFDTVEIVVSINPDKSASMPAEQRASLIREATAALTGAIVTTHAGLTAHYARERGACALIRGVRSASDLAYESQMAAANSQLSPGLETIFLLTSPEHAHTSATLVRDIARWGGNLDTFVPGNVAQALRIQYPKISEQ